MAVDKPQTTPEEIRASMGDAIDKIEVFHNQILVGIYFRPERTKGGIYIPDQVKAEDQWQGKVGLVLKVGSMAFQNDARNDFKGQTVKEDDWIVYRVSDGFPIDVNQVHCRLIEDIHVKMRVSTPDIIW